MTLINPKSDIKVLDSKSDQFGNCLILELIINQTPTLFTTIYGPNKDDPEFWEQLIAKLIDYEYENMIIMGDRNVVMNMKMDSINYTTQQNSNARAVLHNEIDSGTMVDTVRTLYPDPDLLCTGATFVWTKELEEGFYKVQQEAADAIERGVKMFTKDRPSFLCADFSKDGLGFLLLQKYCACQGPYTPICCVDGWKLVLAGGCFIHGPESRYSPVGGEALSVVSALSKAKYIVQGCKNLVVAVDHKPLLKLFGDREYNEIDNNRFLNLKEKTVMYDFTMVHVPGKLHVGSNGISRRRNDAKKTERAYMKYCGGKEMAWRIRMTTQMYGRSAL